MVVMSVFVQAQAPQKMNFQALVCDSANELVTNRSISIEISVLNGSNSAVYTETQTVTTNDNGVATLVVGEGKATQGSFSGIDWSAGNYYLQTTADLGGGASAIVSTTPLLSVPYALYAEKAGGNTYTKEEVDALLVAVESKIGENGGSGEQGNSVRPVQASENTTGSVHIENGAIKALFSVSADEQVYFSQGNLQYQASTNTWRFADNQYDMIGDDNKNISSTYDGWIDLFGWGTSSYNGKDPYMTSTSCSDYGFVVADAINTYLHTYPDIAGTSYDWGVHNAISNGGNAVGQWRTLTGSEWYYVLNRSGLSNYAMVNGVKGLILLPDNWTAPLGIEITHFGNMQTYTISEWTKMEANGAVFLPAAGYRIGSDVIDVGNGYYWSSSAHSWDSTNAIDEKFSVDYSAAPFDYEYNRSYGRSVRLVKMEQAPKEMNFQVLVRNSANELVPNKRISIEISVLNGSNSAVYTETQIVTTNDNGVATLVVGEGKATQGSFSGIDWSAGNYYLQTKVNIGVWSEDIITGTTPLLSVPYALYAEKAGNTYTKAEIDALLAELESKIGEGGGSGEQGNSGNGVSNGMEYVDLGLSVKWATCNIGASKPEEYGNYYAWGETATKTEYDWSTYKYGSSTKLTKYCKDSQWGIVDNKTTLEKSDDVAYTTLGGKWRMPTDAEWTELRTKCNWTWVTYSGVKGYKVEAANGNSIFLPAAGYRWTSYRNHAGSDGIYWSSSLDHYSNYAMIVNFRSYYVVRECNVRAVGYSVRPVLSVDSGK